MVEFIVSPTRMKMKFQFSVHFSYILGDLENAIHPFTSSSECTRKVQEIHNLILIQVVIILTEEGVFANNQYAVHLSSRLFIIKTTDSNIQNTMTIISHAIFTQYFLCVCVCIFFVVRG